MRQYLGMLALIVTVALTSCSSSRITDSWSSDNAKASKNKILVIGLFGKENRAAKNNMESELTRDLNKLDYNAASARDMYGPDAFRGMTEKQALKALQNKGVQSVVTITLVDKDVQRQYVNNYYPGFRPGFWGYYSYYSPWGASPYWNQGYEQVNTTYTFETNLYDLRSGKLVYSSQSETGDTNSSVGEADSYARQVAQDMRTKHVFKNS